MPVHVAKLVLAMAGLLAFLAGTQTDFAWLRWSGIALVAIAWMLRFYRPRQRPIDG
jgi:hypothetical protein